MSADTFQERAAFWIMNCFGAVTAEDINDRSNRFLEEALELYQANGGTKEHALELLNYVFSRPAGNAEQEIGGVMVTLAGVAYASTVNMQEAAESELASNWSKIEEKRIKHATRPKDSPLPGKSIKHPCICDVTEGECHFPHCI